MSSTEKHFAMSEQTTQVFKVFAKKTPGKRYQVMRFHPSLNMDFDVWKNATIVREQIDEDTDEVDENVPNMASTSRANKKDKYKSQSFLLTINDDHVRKYRGTYTGPITQHSVFYVFKNTPEGNIEAYPLQEWYTFRLERSYKTLSAEEAEEEFGRRKNVLNHFTIMMRKRLRDREEEEQLSEEKKSKKSKNMTVTEVDEWMDSDDSSEDNEPLDKSKQKQTDEMQPKKKQKEHQSNLKGGFCEDTDDSGKEGCEIDYDSTSSVDESGIKVRNNRQILGDEECFNLSNSEDEKESESSAEENQSPIGGIRKKTPEPYKDMTLCGPQHTDPATGEGHTSIIKSKFQSVPVEFRRQSKIPTNPPERRPARSLLKSTLALKAELACPTAGKMPMNYHGISVDDVRRYLIRKPMTCVQIIRRFRNREGGLEDHELVNALADIMRGLKPIELQINGVTHYALDGDD